MKRLFLKNVDNRKFYNSIKAKLNYIQKIFFLKIYHICIFSYYTKNVTKFNISSKFLKFFFRSGLIYGIKKYSF